MSRQSITQMLAPAAAAALVLLLSAAPASARQDAGDLSTASSAPSCSEAGQPGAAAGLETRDTELDALTKFRRHGV